MATSANITYRKLYTIGKSKLCWFQTCANGVGRQSGRKDMSKTKMALNPRLRLEVFHVTVKRPSKVGQRKVRSLVRNRNYSVGRSMYGIRHTPIGTESKSSCLLSGLSLPQLMVWTFILCGAHTWSNTRTRLLGSIFKPYSKLGSSIFMASLSPTLTSIYGEQQESLEPACIMVVLRMSTSIL